VKALYRFALPFFVLFALVAGPIASTAAAGDALPKRYVCPPCGSPCDTLSFSAPGVCPTCGMTLVEAGSQSAAPATNPSRKKVAILVFDSVEILDFTGPYEMFGAAGCDVYTVAATKDPVTSAMGLTVVPKFTFADAPQPDVLVIPGGGVYGASRDEATLRYIKDTTARTSYTMSVCNGAFILANTGLLDGLGATTTYHNIPKLTSQYPKIRVVQDQRYVDNGKIITTAGLSAGTDGALHVIAKLFGTGFAQEVALSEEYAWTPDGGYVRAAMADHQLPAVQLDSLGTWEVVRTEGDSRRWEYVVKGHSDLAATEVMSRIEAALVGGKWTRSASASPNATTRSSEWRFTGSDGKPWKGTLKLEGAGHDLTAALTIARAG
jgi:putative intracellular protease/amidase